MRIGLLLVLVIATAPACSYLLVKAPLVTAAPADFVECTERSDYPVQDRKYSYTSFAVTPLWALLGGMVLGIDLGSEKIDTGRATAGLIIGGLVGVLMGAEFLSSAHFGEKATHDCIEWHVRAAAIQRSVRDPLRGQDGHRCRYFDSGWSCDSGLACREVDQMCVAPPADVSSQPAFPTDAGTDDLRRRCISDVYEGPVCPAGKHCGAGGTCEADEIQAPP